MAEERVSSRIALMDCSGRPMRGRAMEVSIKGVVLTGWVKGRRVGCRRLKMWVRVWNQLVDCMI